MRVLAVAHLTLVELWRQRTQWGFILLAVLLALPAAVKVDGMKINGATPDGMGLAAALLGFAQFIAIFLAMSASSGLVANDLDRGTGLILLSKPLSRNQILLGKLLGAGAFMAVAWIGWGLVAAAALSIRLGGAVFLPTFLAFSASMVASWLVVAFCLFWSCWMPANAVMGMAVIGWIVTASAREAAGFAESGGHPILARVLTGIGNALPIGKLSEAATHLTTGALPKVQDLWPAGLIVVWFLIAALVFSNRDLATSN